MAEPIIRRTDGEIQFHYEKSKFFRVVHVDGAAGGLSPGNRQIHMAVFSERTPLPRSMTHLIVNGELGAEIESKRDMKTGAFRELESDLVMTIDVAVAIRDWLNAKIEEAAAINAIVQMELKS